jgi:hypothetical protein
MLWLLPLYSLHNADSFGFKDKFMQGHQYLPIIFFLKKQHMPAIIVKVLRNINK